MYARGKALRCAAESGLVSGGTVKNRLQTPTTESLRRTSEMLAPSTLCSFVRRLQCYVIVYFTNCWLFKRVSLRSQLDCDACPILC